jgi:hypothetical protein
MNRWVCLVLSWASCWGWAQTRDALLDFSLVVPPPQEHHKIVQPVVNWLTRPDAPVHCEQVKVHDGFAVWQEGCVYWSRAQSSCTIVTTGRTTHSQLGRLFLLCLRAGEPA